MDATAAYPNGAISSPNAARGFSRQVSPLFASQRNPAGVAARRWASPQKRLVGVYDFCYRCRSLSLGLHALGVRANYY
jgi:hypothetical protein